MWIVYALASAVFAGATSILAKVGIRDCDSHVVTALRTGVVLVFSWLMVLITGAQAGLAELTGRTMLFLTLSGLATGASWLCYFKALQLGPVAAVAAVDKSSTVLTILLAALLLGEALTLWKGAAVVLIAAGTLLMLDLKPVKGAEGKGSRGWLVCAALSAVFAALTSILAKLGLQDVNSNLATALRTGVVLVMAWGMVFLTGKGKLVRHVRGRSMLFTVLSGIATGASWLCYYKALQMGPASAVAPIDKLSILITVAFARVFLGEKLSRKSLAGLAVLTAGTLLTLL
ncbi:MAG: EamA family transporter [Candidatus Spyradocola sp.]